MGFCLVGFKDSFYKSVFNRMLNPFTFNVIIELIKVTYFCIFLFLSYPYHFCCPIFCVNCVHFFSIMKLSHFFPFPFVSTLQVFSLYESYTDYTSLKTDIVLPLYDPNFDSTRRFQSKRFY